MVFAQLSAKVLYVKAGSNGNGSSWDNAYGDLQLALKAAKSGDQVWVAAGTYATSKQNDRNASFHVTDGIEMYGGFTGVESSLEERDAFNNRTILSGEIGATNTNEDNAYTIVHTYNVSSRTIIDGFVISGGMANGYGDNGDIKSCGAGWFNQGEGSESSPSIKNCIFIDNVAREGAGLYNLARKGQCRPQIANCRFINNTADFDGGAIYNNGNNGECTPQIVKCHFEGNNATYGASILNKGVEGIAKPVVIESVFMENSSIVRGSAIYNYRNGNGVSDAVVQACRFEQNDSTIKQEISNTTNNQATQRNDKSGVKYRASGY